MGNADGVVRLRIRRDVYERMMDACYRFDLKLVDIVRKAFMWWGKRWSFADVPLIEPVPKVSPKVGFTGIDLPEEWEDKQSARLTGLIDAYLKEKDNGSTNGRVEALRIYGPEPEHGAEA